MAEEMLEELGHVQPRQIVGIVAGTRTRSGATNFMRLHMVGDRDKDAVKAAKPGKSAKADKGAKAGKKKK
jgi:pyruvate kinase